MLIVKSNKIVFLNYKHLKKLKRIGCYCYSIDFRHGDFYNTHFFSIVH